MLINIFYTRCLRAVLLTVWLSSTGATAQEVTDLNTTDSTNVNPTLISSMTYALPNADHAITGDTADEAATADFATTADQADRAQNADFATLGDHSNTSGLADLAQNALRLGGNEVSYYTNASNISSGTLDLDRLIGSVVDSDGRIFDSLLAGGTYTINITGNAATSDTADHATTAGSSTSCTGGAASCDY